MNDKRLFPLTAPGEEIEILLNVCAGGEKFSLSHWFQEPSAEDKKAFWAVMSSSELSGKNQSGSKEKEFSALELLYDRCILRVGGYKLPEESKDGGNWKQAIPLEHKNWAVDRLLVRAGTLDRETVKN